MFGYPAPFTPSEERGTLSLSEILYRERVALDRENRLNKEETRVYNDTLTELEFGFGFFRRAHP